MDVVVSGDVGAENAGFASAPEAAGAASDRTSLRRKTLNFLRFASVLVGAGLLLRVGAAEQANSAIDDEKAPAEKSKTTRIAMPEPAFGLQVNSSGNAAIAKSSGTQPAVNKNIVRTAEGLGKSMFLPAETPTPSFASAFGPAVDGAADPAAAQMATSQSSSMARANVSATNSRLEGRSSANNEDANQLALSVDALTGVSASAATPGTAPRAKPTTASKTVQAISLTSRRTASEGLLAPVRITSASDGSRLAPVRAAAAAARPANGSLANAQPRTAPLAPSAANPVASAVIPKPVQISLEAPVMTRGARTTVLTSNITDVMRRPASAWDYAEGLSPELSGTARRSASAQPSGPMVPVPAQTASSPAAPRQVIAGPAPGVSAAQPVQVAPSRVKTAPAERTVAVRSQAVGPAPTGTKIALAQPHTAEAAKVQRPAAVTGEQRVAMLTTDRRTRPVRALRANPLKTALLDFNRDQDELEADEIEPTAPSNLPNSVNYETKGPSAAGAAADSHGGETTTLSLLDRMPQPAF